jgi:hypothetical protein
MFDLLPRYCLSYLTFLSFLILYRRIITPASLSHGYHRINQDYVWRMFGTGPNTVALK